jgi:hypothetical protein
MRIELSDNYQKYTPDSGSSDTGILIVTAPSTTWVSLELHETNDREAIALFKSKSDALAVIDALYQAIEQVNWEHE